VQTQHNTADILPVFLRSAAQLPAAATGGDEWMMMTQTDVL